MLKILNRYIIKKFLGTFLFVVLIFSLIAVIIDFSQNVEEFIDEQLPAGQVMQEYYLNFVLFINGLLWPLFAMISVIFFTSRMAYNSEIISILNAGVSFRLFYVALENVLKFNLGKLQIFKSKQILSGHMNFSTV